MEIEGLYKACRNDLPRIIETLKDAFFDYSKWAMTFSSQAVRQKAVIATINYYAPYDFKYGAFFSSDKNLHDAVCLIHSDEMSYSEERLQAAGSYDEGFQQALRQLTPGQQQTWWDFFAEFDRLEAQVNLPYPHLYIDYLGVKQAFQRQGRGRRLMTAVGEYADSVKLPVMLFTNPEEDIRFYESIGFQTVETVVSETFGFKNTYMVRFF